MEVIFAKSDGRCFIQYTKGASNSLKFTPSLIKYISIDRGHLFWKQRFAHELAHLLIAPYLEFSRSFPFIIVPRYCFMDELLAWRVAKSYCKAKYWNEEDALYSLNTYHKGLPKEELKEASLMCPPMPDHIEPLEATMSAIKKEVARYVKEWKMGKKRKQPDEEIKSCWNELL